MGFRYFGGSHPQIRQRHKDYVTVTCKDARKSLTTALIQALNKKEGCTFTISPNNLNMIPSHLTDPFPK